MTVLRLVLERVCPVLDAMVAELQDGIDDLITELIKRFSPDASFAMIAAELPCWFCNSNGLEVFELVGNRSGGVLPTPRRLA